MATTIETLQPNADFACIGWNTSAFGFCNGTLWSFVDEGIGFTDALYTQCFNPPIPLSVRYDLTAPTPGLGILQSIRVGIHAAVNSTSDNFTLRVFDGATQLGGDQIINVTANFPTGADYYTLPIDVSSLGLTEAHLSDMRVEVETAINPAIIFYVWTLDVELTWDDGPVVLDIDLASTDVYGLNRIAQAVTPDTNWDVDQVFLDNVWASQPVTAYIVNDSAGQPTGSLIATSNAISVPSTNPGAPATFTFPSTVSLSQGVKYWFVFYSPQEDAFTFRNNAAAGSGREIAAYNGATWTVSAFDFAQFKLLGVSIPPPFYDEFNDSSIAGFWTQATGNTSIEDTAEGGTNNYAGVGINDQAGLFQEYPQDTFFTTTVDLVMRVKVDTTMVKGGNENFCNFKLNIFDGEIDIDINFTWAADLYVDGSGNAGLARHVLECNYQTDVENESERFELPEALTNDWALLRIAHVAGELGLFFSPDPFTQWYDITPTAVSTRRGQVGGVGSYGWGFEFRHRQFHDIGAAGNYRGFADYVRDSSGFLFVPSANRISDLGIKPRIQIIRGG